MKIIKTKAFAKINLGLQVVNKRTDGFHNINTIFLKTLLYDEIEIRPFEDLKIECYPALNIPIEQNLVYKAVKKLERVSGSKKLNVLIKIRKNIPAGGGLGGGSSDAASVLVALNKLSALQLDFSTLFKIAAELGSDVPYFLKQGTAEATGRGELLDYFRFDLGYPVLLVFPGIHVDTGLAYKSLNRSADYSKPTDFKKIIKGDLMKYREFLYNDFELSAFSQNPELKKIKEKLYAAGAAYAQMSGSGSTLFGVFRNNEEASAAKQSLKKYNTFLS